MSSTVTFDIPRDPTAPFAARRAIEALTDRIASDVVPEPLGRLRGLDARVVRDRPHGRRRRRLAPSFAERPALTRRARQWRALRGTRPLSYWTAYPAAGASNREFSIFAARTAPRRVPPAMPARCGPTVYLGSAADWKPARKMLQRSHIAAASSSAPPAAAAGRRRPRPAINPAPVTDRAIAACLSLPAAPVL